MSLFTPRRHRTEWSLLFKQTSTFALGPDSTVFPDAARILIPKLVTFCVPMATASTFYSVLLPLVKRDVIDDVAAASDWPSEPHMFTECNISADECTNRR